MSEEVAAGFGDLVEEMQAELDMLLAQEKADIPMSPSTDLPELLAAAIREIQGMREIINRTNS